MRKVLASALSMEHQAVLSADVDKLNSTEFKPSRSYFELNWLSWKKHFGRLPFASQIATVIADFKDCLSEQVKLLSFIDERMALCNSPSNCSNGYQHKFACTNEFFCPRCKTRQALVKRNGILDASKNTSNLHFLTLTPARRILLNSEEADHEVRIATNQLSTLYKKRIINGFYWEIETSISNLSQREIKPHLHAIIDINPLYTAEDIKTVLDVENLYVLFNDHTLSPIDGQEGLLRVIHYMNKPVGLAHRYGIEAHNLTHKQQYDLNLSAKEIVQSLKEVYHRKRKFSSAGTLKFSYKAQEIKLTREYKEKIKPAVYKKLIYRKVKPKEKAAEPIQERNTFINLGDVLKSFCSSLDPPQVNLV